MLQLTGCLESLAPESLLQEAVRQSLCQKGVLTREADWGDNNLACRSSKGQKMGGLSTALSNTQDVASLLTPRCLQLPTQYACCISAGLCCWDLCAENVCLMRSRKRVAIYLIIMCSNSSIWHKPGSNPRTMSEIKDLPGWPPAIAETRRTICRESRHAASPQPKVPESEAKPLSSEKKAAKPVLGQSPAVGALIEYRETAKKPVSQMAPVEEDQEGDEEAEEASSSRQVRFLVLLIWSPPRDKRNGGDCFFSKVNKVRPGGVDG